MHAAFKAGKKVISEHRDKAMINGFNFALIDFSLLSRRKRLTDDEWLLAPAASYVRYSFQLL